MVYPDQHGELQYYYGENERSKPYLDRSWGKPSKVDEIRQRYPKGHAMFYYIEDSPYVKLQLLGPVATNEEILTDYSEEALRASMGEVCRNQPQLEKLALSSYISTQHTLFGPVAQNRR